jgi:hypothetical protein
MTDTDLKGKVQAWLKRQGYPLELRVAAAFQRAGFHVQQGSYFEDPETMDPGSGQPVVRELDVRAWTEFTLRYPDSPRLESVIVEFAIQCKAAPAPWVAFLPVQASRPDILEYPATAQPQSEDFRLAMSCSDWSAIQHALRVEWPFAYSLTTAHLDSKEDHGRKDSGYEALITAAKASWASVAAVQRGLCLKMSIPMVVTSGALLTGALEGDEVRVNDAESCLVGFEYVFPVRLAPQGIATYVRVTTAKGLPAAAAQCAQIAAAVKSAFEAATTKILGHLDGQRAAR